MRSLGSAASLVAAMLLGACTSDPPRSQPLPASTTVAVGHDGEVNPRLLRRFKPIAAPADLPDAVVTLGRALFHDARLSAKSELSCSSCHPLDHFGTDGKIITGRRNVPSVYNASLAFTLYWDGRAGTLEEQAKRPILDEREMAMKNGEAVVARLAAIPEYPPAFKAAFPEESQPLTFDNVARAISAFERRLLTPSRWDRFLEGESEALTAKEKGGLKVFLNSGCMVCHTGPLLGGATFERVGVVEPWPNQSDPGRMAITGQASDRMSFKVPSLRNVTKTGPYFHDGSSATLPDAVRRMGRHQLGLELRDDEVDAIVAWLGSLTGAPADAAPSSQLRVWMKANAAPAIASGRFESLGAAFERMQQLDPHEPAYADWSRFASEGQAAAKAMDLEACRGACRGCHDAYRSSYRQKTTQESSPLAVGSIAAP